MDDFCGSEFWNRTLVWDSGSPELTPCFEQTILVWAPCAFLWLFSILDIVYIHYSNRLNIPWSFLNISKLVLTVALVILTIADLSAALINNKKAQVFAVHFYTPAIKIASFIYAGILLYFNKKHGQQTSGLLFLFWFFYTLFSLPRCITEIRRNDYRNDNNIENSWQYYQFISSIISFVVCSLILVLNFFADREPLNKKYSKSTNPCPEMRASFPSRLFFTWFDKLAWHGFRKHLEHKDLWDMRPDEAANEVTPKFLKYWQQSRDKYADKKDPVVGGASSKSRSNPSKPKKQASVVPALCKAFGPTFLFGSFLKIGNDLLTFASPQILRLIINFVDSDEPSWKGIFYAFLLFIAAAVQTLFLAQYFNRMFFFGLRTRTALIGAIYRKALKMSNISRKKSTVGEIVNLMTVDTQRFMDLTPYLNMLWSAPLQIGLALFFLWDILGPSVLAGLAVMIILIPVNGVIANKAKKLQIKQMKNKDKRVKLMNEILSGIKVLKLYAWEPSFEAQILKIRGKEVKVLKSAAYLNAATSFIFSCAPFMVSLASFATFVLVDEANVLDSTTAFVSLSLFNILRFPLSMLPMLISNLVQTTVSVKRINKFMNCEELDSDNVHHDTSEEAPLIIENGTFSWGEEETTLKNINMKVNANELVAIVGTVGSGKSSLLSAYLGEMEKLAGRVNTVGKVAYVSQQAWIQNATLQENILFGKSMDRKLYDKCIVACALKPDIDMLPGGDQTEIGEKGINLSGGQKQRVSLARAVYNNADIYFLDDPLSAVDSHVGKHIFEEVIGPNGLLGEKTRVLVTNAITYLPQTNNIYVLKDGEISEAGSYQELIERKGAFSDFLLQHLQEVVDSDDELDEINQQIELTVSNAEIRTQMKNALNRSRSESISLAGVNPKMAEKDGGLSPRSSLDGSIRRRNSEPKSLNAMQEDNKLIELEKSETGSVKWAVYKHYLKSIGITLSVLTFVFNLIFQCFATGSSFWLTNWSNDERTGNDTSLRNMYVGVYAAFGVGQALANFVASMTFALGALYAAKEMHIILLKNVLRWPMELFDVTPLGRIMNRFSKDVDGVDNILPAVTRPLLPMLFAVIATLTVISISTPIFMSVIVPIGALYCFIQKFYVSTSRQLKRLESVSRSPIYSHFGETITGAQTIRAYTVQDRFIGESDAKVDFNQVCFFPSIIANRWLAVRLEMIGNMIILFSALFAVLGRETMNAALVGLSVSFALQITQTLNWLVRMTSEMETNIVAVERIKEYGETKQEAPWVVENVKVSPDWPENGQVIFNNLKVRYREGLDLVLKGISFTVEGGEKVGIVGRTGAGKSSLTLALFRIIESAGGTITIDGQDISTLGLHALRSRLTIIPQDPVLFSGTLRLNLDPFNVYSDEEIWRSLENAHLKTFVKGLSAEIYHEITEGGDNLSVGQRQLICLARALLRKTKVLVLDEATAAIDLDTDVLIQRTIRTEFKDCTVLTIAHRLNTILDSDKVIVLDKGRIVEYASPDELLANKSSAFYSMVKDAGIV